MSSNTSTIKTEFLGGRKLVSSNVSESKTGEVKSSKHFSIASYNILAQCYVNTPKFPYCKAGLLKWYHRRQSLLEEITDLDCDILCLQEVDNYDTWWMPQLQALGYDSVYAKRGGDCQDGVCVMYRRDMFQLFRSDHVNFNQVDSCLSGVADTANTCKDNVALIATLQPWEDSVHPSAICVVSAHLFSPRSPEDQTVQHKQVQMLLKKVEEANSDFQLPIVLNGSFNFFPNSSEYHIVTSGCEPPQLLYPNKLQVAPIAQAISRSQIRVTWEAPNCGDAPIEGYVIRRCAGGNRVAGFENEKRVEGADTTEVTICGLSSGVSYEFIVAAVSAVGVAEWSEPSRAVATYIDIANPPANVHLTHPSSSYEEAKTSSSQEGKSTTDVNSDVDIDQVLGNFRSSQQRGKSSPRRKRNGKRVHHLRLNSAYQSYNNGSEPRATCCTESFKACVDFMFFSRDSLIPLDILSLPELSTLKAQDPRRVATVVDEGDAKPQTWDCEEKVAMFDVLEGKTKSVDNPSYMGDWVPHSIMLPFVRRLRSMKQSLQQTGISKCFIILYG